MIRVPAVLAENIKSVVGQNTGDRREVTGKIFSDFKNKTTLDRNIYKCLNKKDMKNNQPSPSLVVRRGFLSKNV